ncbi:MAG: DUF4203 domain-containing protein [Chthoniobacterales bacterium]
MQNTALTLVVAALLLFLGRRIYWLFVGGVGFFIAMDWATRMFAPHSQTTLLLIGLVAGLVGALLAIFFQRLAVALAGFFAGGHFALLLLPNLGFTLTNQSSVIAFIVAGIIAALLALALFSWALIILSAMIGAALIAQWAAQTPSFRALIFLVLFVIGFAAQASMLRRSR